MTQKQDKQNFQADLQGEGEAKTLTLGGRLDVYATDQLLSRFQQVLATAGLKTLTVDLSGVKYLDTGGVMALNILQQQAAEAGVQATLQGLNKRAQGMMDIIRFDELAPLPPKPKRPPGGYVSIMGKATLELVQDVAQVIAFVGTLILALGRVIRRPRSLRWGDTELYMEQVGVDGLPIVGLISFLLGLIMAFMSAIQLKTFGANIYVADLVALSMVRELGPIMTAVLVAGRSGSAFAAEIGTMIVREEVEALEVMGFDPATFLALPRMVAMVLMVPLLILFSDLLAITGGLVIGVTYLDLTVYSYVEQTMKALTINDILLGASKGVIFAFLIAGIGCQRGFTARGGAEAVGRVTTSAVVAGIFLIVVSDSIFAVVQYYFL
ncbi:MAG: MlaE family lipid ABC transporter permease subunit [Proteobacteria bacterium]|nr:MlaE family lipid ABC transporter permease subunit [Pseudomonadota bacterium]MBU2467439.1 MlaE family lipid ABC transporter permease subunit [Pseudomonadota bacterium]MBU2516978.1 MlaE family lipid ABC transporter permease subunit [Pseudomonadota bacterium]